MRFGVVLYVLMGMLVLNAAGSNYYLDSRAGNDANDGLSPETAWATLEKASAAEYNPGDQILLKRGAAFRGKLALKWIKAERDVPFLVDVYGDGKALPVIDSAGYISGITIEDCSYVKVKNVEITSDGGKAIDPKAKTDRYGVYVSRSTNVSIEYLNINKIFATIQTPSEGREKMTAYGHGIRIEDSERARVLGCKIERVGRYGINVLRSSHLLILHNETDHTGCSGLQMSRCKDAEVRGNTFDHPGSFIDDRMHGRGSGSWVWGCEKVLYEKNNFLNAKGKADSCGVHIDFNCRDIVIQYCFSMNNEGGFIEILGNNHNCAYRYNISVNDGSRAKGENGAHQEGKTFWLSGYCGKKPCSGPFNSYIYNNTIYVKEGAAGRFSITPSAQGALVANNIFHLLGPTSAVGGDQRKYKATKDKATGIVFKNNLYVHDSVLPAELGLKDTDAIFGDVGFMNPGGTSPEDYIPTNKELVKDRGIAITSIPDDEIGLRIGLEVRKDFFGNPVKDLPDVGAVELP